MTGLVNYEKVEKMNSEKKREFFKKNIERKKEDMQEEHMILLREIFENYKEKTADHVTAQCYWYSELSENMKDIMPNSVLIVCLHDLQTVGFIMNVVLDYTKQAAYAITPLGRQVFKLGLATLD